MVYTLQAEIERMQGWRYYGRVVGVQGLLVEVAGAQRSLSIGSRVNLLSRQDKVIPCEVVGFKSDSALLMSYSMLEGVGVGCRAFVIGETPVVHPSAQWLGRVVNAMGEPIDGKGPIKPGAEAYPLRAQPPAAHLRQRVGEKIDLGVRCLNTFVTCCKG
ncbi:MAG: hypothetical protein L3J50_05065, partial [Emcibacter sp.]|nr:hypothetical protein [Emcibacter sp.]